ncbi:MAG TPA: hypothetical protein VK498_15780 [Ferruginibacter sp.]|nr:hypothetical protein [Ferruginibacter sp.]
MRIIICLTLLAIQAVFPGCNKKKEVVLKETRELKYPSASGVICYNKVIYIIGDDAPYILTLDYELNIKDSIPLFDTSGKRIPKNTKPDLESLALVNDHKNPTLLAMGSGSLIPYRNICILLDPVTNIFQTIRLDTFYKRINDAGIKELNIEGAASIPGGILLASRGNKAYPKNNLVLTTSGFWNNQDSAEIRLIKTGVNTDTSFFNGISGLEYSKKSDRLLLAVSTENTYNSLADGTIGKSYLWIINDISSKKRFSAINPNRVIDLEETDKRFIGQKIESVCILNETRKQMELLLVSDNDKGSSVLFRLLLEK